MDTTATSLIIWLLGVNILLIILIIIDRFLIMRKRASDLEDKFVKEALANLHEQIQKTNRELSNNTVEFQKRAQDQTLQLLDSIRTTIFTRYETEFQIIDQSVAQSIAKLQQDASRITSNIYQEMVHNNRKIKETYETLMTELDIAIKQAIEDAQQEIKTSLRQNQDQIQKYMAQQIEQRINHIVNTILHNSITLRDHEQLIDEAIQEYIKAAGGEE